MTEGPTLSTLSKQDALALPYPEELAVRAGKLHEALAASREDGFTLARGNPSSLSRTYGARLAAARSARAPTAGIQELLAVLDSYEGEHLWGFTVRDSSTIYVGFTDDERTALLAVVMIARQAADSLLIS